MYHNFPKPFRIALTFIIVLLGWVFFRASDLPRAIRYLAEMFGFAHQQAGAALISGVIYKPYYLLSLGVAAIVVWAGKQTWDWTQSMTLPKVATCFACGWLALAVLVTQEYNPFIYFIFKRMSARRPEPPLRPDEPRPPRHSLPRYADPTPETHRRISREEEAEQALNNTSFTPVARQLLIVLFLITIVSVPLIQTTAELHRAVRLSAFAIFKPFPSWKKTRNVRNPMDLWQLLPHASEIKAAEKTVEEESILVQWLLPRTQMALTAGLHAGNEQVYLGRDGWLFYRADVDYVTGPPFLDAARMAQRSHTAAVQPDAIKAIVDFRNQLAARGIDLIVVPVPVKPSVDADRFSTRARADAAVDNASFSEFTARLTKEGVRVF